MVKIITSVTIDVDAYIKAKEQRINLSKTFSDYLIELVDTPTGVEVVDGEKPGDELRRLKLQKLRIDNEIKAKEKAEKKAVDEQQAKFKGKKYYCEKTRGMLDAEQYKLVMGVYPE